MKTKLTVLLFVLAAQLSNTASAQEEEKKNQFSLHWGYGHLIRQDMSATPMIHKDASPVNIKLTYSHVKNFEHDVEVKFGMYNPQLSESYDFFFEPDNMLQTFKHDFKMLDLNYSFGKSVYANDKLNIVAGVQSSNRLNASEYAFGALSFFSYYFSFGLDARLKLDYEVNDKNKFHFSAALPLFAMNTRSPYLLIDADYLMDNYEHKPLPALKNYIKRAKFQSWKKSQGADITLGYDHVISDKWSIGCDYQFTTSFNQSPTNFSSIENVLFIGAKLNF